MKKLVLVLMFLFPVLLFSESKIDHFALSIQPSIFVGIPAPAVEVSLGGFLGLYACFVYADVAYFDETRNFARLTVQPRIYFNGDFYGVFAAGGLGAQYNIEQSRFESLLILNAGYKWVIGNRDPKGFFLEPRIGWERTLFKESDVRDSVDGFNYGLGFGFNF